MMSKRAGILALVIIAAIAFWMRPEKRVGRNADAGSFILRAHAQTANYGGATTVGSFSANCIPLAPTATTMNCSALTDGGTNVTSTEAFLAPVGSATLPGYAFSGGANNAASGMWWVSGSVGIIGTNGTTGWLTIGANNGGIQTGAIQAIGWSSSSTPFGNNSDAAFRRRAAANIQMGVATDVNGVPVAQTISVQNAITGSNLPGAAAFTIAAPLGTGNGAGSSTQFQRSIMQATGTTAQTGVAAFVVCESKTLSNTSATVQALANIALASNSAGGARGSITVTATDGTNFDSETQDFVVSYVNKATVGTVGTAAITASTAANNSGSATIGMTATFAGTTLSINATPVFTTIVPTTVTAYLELQNHGAGAVTCQ